MAGDGRGERRIEYHRRRRRRFENGFEHGARRIHGRGAQLAGGADSQGRDPARGAGRDDVHSDADRVLWLDVRAILLAAANGHPRGPESDAIHTARAGGFGGAAADIVVRRGVHVSADRDGRGGNRSGRRACGAWFARRAAGNWSALGVVDAAVGRDDAVASALRGDDERSGKHWAREADRVARAGEAGGLAGSEFESAGRYS